MFDKHKSKQPSVNTEETPPENPVSVSSTINNRRSAVIGSKIVIKGDISGDEDLIIEGQVDGSIQLSSNTVNIGATGKVNANIDAKIISVDGEVTGDINGSEKVIVSKAGRVKGNIVAPRVTLEDGAKFKGSIDMDPGVGKTTELPISSIDKNKSQSHSPQQQSVPLSAKAGN